MPSCPVCMYTNATIASLHPEIRTVDCSGCGRYDIQEDLAILLERNPLSERQRANASGWLRGTGATQLAVSDYGRLRALPTPSVPAKAERLMLYITREFPDPGTRFQIFFDPAQRALMSAVNNTECGFIASYCKDQRRWLDGTVTLDPAVGTLSAMVTPDGWAYVASLTERGPQSPFGFVAMHFTEATRILREDGVKAAIVAAGYDARLVDEVHPRNHVDDEILAAIQRSRFLIADLNGQRQNVYYEAGFAQGLGKEVIWTCSEVDLATNANHFDVRQYAFVGWLLADLPDFRRRLTARIVSILGLGPIRL